MKIRQEWILLMEYCASIEFVLNLLKTVSLKGLSHAQILHLGIQELSGFLGSH